MPWPEKQRQAIFLDVQRRKGTGAAKRVMHEAGYGSSELAALLGSTSKPPRRPVLHKTQAARLKAAKRWMTDRVENFPAREEK